MHQRKDNSPPLLGNRLAALMAVCLTGFLASRDFRLALSGAAPKSSWLINLDSFSLPFWAIVAVNLAAYLFLIWMSVGFYRWAQGKERIVVGGWFTAAIFGLLSPFLEKFPAAAITGIRTIRGLAMALALSGAIAVFVERPPFGKNDAVTAGRLFLFLGGLVVFALVFGAAIYFFPRR